MAAGPAGEQLDGAPDHAEPVEGAAPDDGHDDVVELVLRRPDDTAGVGEGFFD